MSVLISAIFLIVSMASLPLSCSFVSTSVFHRTPPQQFQLSCYQSNDIDDCMSKQRRTILSGPLITTAGSIFPMMFLDTKAAHAADEQFATLLDQIKEASRQLDDVPDLIKTEKWDSVRAILVKPPLSNMWTSGGANKLLNNYAVALGEQPDGDEIAALELREDIISHLRYLDMAVYNNVFNPIGSEGTTGATKELVRSYYEDPINEFKASKKAIDELIGLAPH